MSAGGRKVALVSLVVLLLVVLTVAAGALVVHQRSLRAELEQARDALAAGRIGVAHARLVALADRWTGDGEVYLLLGEAKLARNERMDALEAWSRVPETSPFFGRAALLRATHLINIGRYTPAEDVLRVAIKNPPAALQYDLERALSRVYAFEGRFGDFRRVLRAVWSRSPNPAGVLKELWTNDHSPMPVEAMKRALDAADEDDDRVWLGRANQAILTGRFADASGWLERCTQRRPGDPPVWQARLDLAVATGNLNDFWTAAGHLPSDRFYLAAVHNLRAWLAARLGNDSLEREELTKLLEQAPGDAPAIERLAALAVAAGKTGDAEQLHRRKAAIDRAHDTYRKIMLEEGQIVDRADELALLAAVLGRGFDAQAWTLLAEARRRGLAAALGASGTGSRPALPDDLFAKASALSSRFEAMPPHGSGTEGKLRDLLEDLHSAAAESRLTAGPAGWVNPGTAPAPTPAFRDDAVAIGLRFRFDNGQTLRHLLPETMSGGVALLDFDGDGWLDVYCVQGGVLDPSAADPGKTAQPDGDRLFRNRGDGSFDDVTERSGIARIAWGQGYGLGVTVGDYDNDGHADLFVTRVATYALYRNRGDGTFEDVTGRAGLAGRRDNPTSAAFADLDNDGDLDLYVCHYMTWDPANPQLCPTEKGDYFYCSPHKVQPAPDHVFRNDGGRFVDVTEAAGCVETEGHGLGVVAADLDGDGRIDLYVANDGTANYLYRNLGGFHFEDIGLQAGVAGGAQGGYQAGMGVACGDMNGDGLPDLMVTNFYGEGTTLYQNLGHGLFADRSAASGIGLATRYLLGFGIAMVDVANIGRLDVVITNGHVNDNRRYYPYAMPSRLYQNQPDGRLVDVSGQAGPPWDVLRVGRGLAAGDLDNDGRIDTVIIAQNEPLSYFHNQTSSVGGFITLKLEGTKCNRDAVGARVTVTAGGRRQVAQRTGGGSYQSANDHRLHFGLGACDRVEVVEVRWPSGTLDQWRDLRAGTGYLLREGETSAQPLAGFPVRSPGQEAPATRTNDAGRASVGK
jgi:tetratricopeptide (TPR) repeat protein